MMKHVLVFGEESSTDDEVVILKLTNHCENLSKQKFDLAIISLVTDFKTLNDFALSFNEDDGHLQSHMRLNLLKDLLMTFNSNLVPNLLTMCSGKTCVDNAMF